jgi:segregation and condensation protein A
MPQQQQIFDLLLNSDEVTWQTIIYQLVREEGMNPWDIDISLLTKKYIQMLKKLKEMDFRISGKVVLAAAILLKIKCAQLVGEDMNQLDRLIASAEETDDQNVEDFYNQLEGELSDLHRVDGTGAYPTLMPKTPQPRTRKVSIYDLMDALDRALAVNRRRVLRQIPEKRMERPKKERDVTMLILDVYERVRKWFNIEKKPLMFTELLRSDTKEEKILTFVPLLHLVKDRKIDLEQKEHFGPIEITLHS